MKSVLGGAHKEMWICNKYSLQKKDRINKKCSNFWRK